MSIFKIWIGIDISSKSNYVVALDFFGNKLLLFDASNNIPGSEKIVANITSCLK